jgi:hypothetical protein
VARELRTGDYVVHRLRPLDWGTGRVGWRCGDGRWIVAFEHAGYRPCLGTDLIPWAEFMDPNRPLLTDKDLAALRG